MKLALKILAIELRKQGKTYSEIRAEIAPVSKGTLSRWLKDLKLSSAQETRIKRKMLALGHAGRQKGTQRNRQKRFERLERIKAEAVGLYPKLAKNPRFLAGLMLYLAEGNKKQERFELMNSDPYLVTIISQWVAEFGKIPLSDIRYRLYIHNIYAHEECEQFWSDFLGLAPNQLLKTIYKPTPHLVKRNPQYRGCIRVEVPGSELYWKVRFWQECLYNSIGRSMPSW